MKSILFPGLLLTMASLYAQSPGSPGNYVGLGRNGFPTIMDSILLHLPADTNQEVVFTMAYDFRPGKKKWAHPDTVSYRYAGTVRRNNRLHEPVDIRQWVAFDGKRTDTIREHIFWHYPEMPGPVTEPGRRAGAARDSAGGTIQLFYHVSRQDTTWWRYFQKKTATTETVIQETWQRARDYYKKAIYETTDTSYRCAFYAFEDGAWKLELDSREFHLKNAAGLPVLDSSISICPSDTGWMSDVYTYAFDRSGRIVRVTVRCAAKAGKREMRLSLYEMEVEYRARKKKKR